MIEYIAKRVIEEGDCLVWQLGLVNGHPNMRMGNKSVLVRRYMWQTAHGNIPKGKVLRCTCGEPRCVNVDHIQPMTYQQIAKIEGRAGKMSGHIRSAKIAETKRRTTAKITMEMAREIRASSETGVALAKKYGISQKKISYIRLNKVWREYVGNPFAGLGGRLA